VTHEARNLIPLAAAHAVIWTVPQDDLTVRIRIRILDRYPTQAEHDWLKPRGGFRITVDPKHTGDAGLLREYDRYGWACMGELTREIAKLDCPMGAEARAALEAKEAAA
jgi:hypothetical protein